MLDLSKLHMFDFYYSFLVKEIGDDNLICAYYDTDCFVLQTTRKDIYELIKDHPDYFDTSNFPSDNQFGVIRANCKKTGCFKDESPGLVMQAFIGLRAKAYVILYNNQTLVKKLKSVNKSTKSKLEFADFEKVWKQRNTFYATMYRILSTAHVIETVEIRRRVMNGDDDKRFLCEDNVSTLALGHYKIAELTGKPKSVSAYKMRNVS